MCPGCKYATFAFDSDTLVIIAREIPVAIAAETSNILEMTNTRAQRFRLNVSTVVRATSLPMHSAQNLFDRNKFKHLPQRKTFQLLRHALNLSRCLLPRLITDQSVSRIIPFSLELTLIIHIRVRPPFPYTKHPVPNTWIIIFFVSFRI